LLRFGHETLQEFCKHGLTGAPCQDTSRILSPENGIGRVKNPSWGAP